MKKILLFLFAFLLGVMPVAQNIVFAEEVTDSSTEYENNEFSDSQARDGYKLLCRATGYNSSWKKDEPDKCMYLKDGNMKNVAAYLSTNKPNTYENRYYFISSISSPSWLNTYWTGWIDSDDRSKWTRSSQTLGGESVYMDFKVITLNCYLFDTEAKARAYLRGEIDASAAENFGEVTPEDYNSDIPLPDSFEIKYLDRSTVDCFFSYSNDTELSSFGKELHYEIVPDYVYATTSFTKAIVGGTALGATGNAAKMCQYIQSTVQGGVMNLSTTVEDYIADPKNNKNKLYTQADKTPITGIVSASNSQSMTPTDYSGKFSSSAFSAFWGGATNMNIAYFVGAQLSLRIYYIEDGKKYYSNKVVVRYFSNDIINSLVGKKKTVVGKDDKGDDIVIDDGPTDPTTPITPGDIKDVDLVSYVKRLFISITSYTALMQSMLVHVPAEIWYLIAAALAVSLAVIVFKVLRGM